MNIKKKLKQEKCLYCGTIGALFICSFGAVNCSECGEFIRKANGEELKIVIKKLRKLKKFLEKNEIMAAKEK